MSEYSDAILNAVKIVVDRENSKLARDLTVLGDIVSVVDADLGEYRAKHNGDIITVFARTPEELYKIGERVYITVPEGNFSGIKIIYGRVERASLESNNMSRAASAIIEVSPTFDQLYGYDASAKYGVVAGAPIGSSYRTRTIGTWPRTYYHGSFLRYADEYEFIRIKGTFLTEFLSVHTNGNYGLELTFYTADNSSISYRLDVNSFNGDPYHLVTATPQEIILLVLKNYLAGLASIVLFEEDFEYDEYVRNGLPSGTYNTNTPNIFVQDLVIQYVDRTDLSADTYYLAIATQKGSSFTSSIRTLTLLGKLLFQGQDLYSDSTCECKWFIQDPSITVASDDYDKDAGLGWKPLAGESSNVLTLSISSSEVWYLKKYKLVVIYKSRNLLFAEQNVYNLMSAYQSYFLEQTSNNGGLLLLIRDNTISESLVGEWYILYPDGKYTSLVSGQKLNAVAVEDYLLYTSAIVYCVVYTPNGSSYLGILDYTIVNSTLLEDVTITYLGEDTFRYDANGDITIEDSEKERYLKPLLSWKDGVYGTGAKLEWYAMDGTYLAPGGAALSISSDLRSMISDIYLDSNYILHYHIRLKFLDYYNNNTLTLKILTSGNTYTFKKEILFLKDGDLGTNGTSYICAIRPCDVNGNKLSAYAPLTYNGGWTNSVRLRCYVYHDGNLLDSSYSVTYNWDTSDGVSLTMKDTEQTVASGTGILLQPRYVKVLVLVRDNVNREYVSIYALYPLDVVVGGMNISNINIDIPQFIKYTTSGLTPLYYNNVISCLYGSTAASITSLNTKLLTVDSDNRLKPSPNFLFENNTIGLLRCSFNSSLYILHSVVMYLNTYGNEAINGWDGTNLKTTDGYLLAPLVGAGTKDNTTNLFTGVVMGKDTALDKVGLYGYESGLNVFGLRQDGIAYFGKSGIGRIIVNGNSATIYGGTSSPTSLSSDPDPTTNGMIIRLSNRTESGTTAAILIGRTSDDNFFKIGYDGKLICLGVDVKGIIKAETGYIGGSGGWQITEGVISSANGNVKLYASTNYSSAGYAIQAGSNFKVSFDGTLNCSNATVSGNITADTLTATGTGSIGGWTISKTTLTGGSTTLDSGGTITTNTFVIKNSGSNYGKIGYVSTSLSGSGIGIAGIGVTIVEGTGNTRLSSSGGNVFVLANSGTVNLLGSQLYCSVPASAQSGIYARFA